jgi:DNA-directed RNA polymerase subunit RPC12/RpoP
VYSGAHAMSMATTVACPQCNRKLQVPTEQAGRTLRCPDCAHVFGAQAASAGPTGPPPLPDADEFAAPLSEVEAAQLAGDVDAAERSERQREQRQRRSKKSSGGGYYDELMRKQRKLATPHRGVLILVFGICSILCSMGLVGVAFGVLAWNWGTNDLNEMLCGRMDRNGRGLTQVGRILGMVGLGLCAVWILASCGCGILGGLAGSKG